MKDVNGLMLTPPPYAGMNTEIGFYPGITYSIGLFQTNSKKDMVKVHENTWKQDWMDTYSIFLDK